MDYVAHIAIVIMIYFILALALNLLMGYTGLFSFAHGAFFGIGAYAMALVLINMGVHFVVGMIIAVLVSMAVASVVARLALRMRSDYLVLLTLGLQVIIFGLMVSWRGLTRGQQGIPSIPRPEFFGLTMVSPPSYLPLVIGMTILVFFIIRRITHSPFGRVLKSIREDEDVALSFGKDVTRNKILVFMLAGGLAAVGGSLFATYTTYISPLYFKIDTSLLMVAIVALGGLASIWGTLAGTLLLVALPEILTFVVGEVKIGTVELMGYELLGPLRAAIYGGLLILFMRFRPQGLIPEYTKFGRDKAPAIATMSPEEADKILWQEGVERELQEGQNELQPVVEVNGLCKNFGGIRAADDLSLTLPKGKITALIGPNGAGKTTAYNLITSFLKADAGRVYYRGRDITKSAPHRITHLGLVRSFQGARVLEGMSVLDNVLSARPKQSGENLWRLFFRPWKVAAEERENRRYAMACLHFVGLAEKAQSLAAECSFGQKKRLQIACLLATEAEVLLLDEPVSGVDPKRIVDITELMRKLVSHGKTICIIEHNLDVVKDAATFAYFLDQGHVVAKDTPSALMTDQKLAELYFGT